MFGLDSIYLRSDAVSRSISAENPDGTPGGGGRATAETTLHPPSARCARELGPGWKMSPCRSVAAGETVTLMDTTGPGIIRHIWMTLDPSYYRDLVLRVTWDDARHPAILTPIGDFFCCAWGTARDLAALPVNVNPKGGLNCWLPMPFRGRACITVTNEGDRDLSHLFYQIDYTLESVPDDALRLHAHFRRDPILESESDYIILQQRRGRGHYVGTFMAWEQRSPGWWGEGEIKMYLDGDRDHPTICGTGTEDYFGGAWCFGRDFDAPFLGYAHISGEVEKPGARHTMYRFHLSDPVYFRKELTVTMQALGWQNGGRYLPLNDDIASVAWWYQDPSDQALPELPDLPVRRAGCMQMD